MLYNCIDYFFLTTFTFKYPGVTLVLFAYLSSFPFSCTSSLSPHHPLCLIFQVFLAKHIFTPSNFDSVLSPHSNYNDNDNIDQHLGCNCKLAQTHATHRQLGIGSVSKKKTNKQTNQNKKAKQNKTKTNKQKIKN